MQMIIEFFEYTLSGWVYFIYFTIMMICSFACLGVVGEKVSKKKHAELIAKREAAAQEEYKKAQELIDKQAHSYGIDHTLDPTAKKQAAEQKTAPMATTTQSEVVQPASEVVVPVVEQPKEREVVVLDAPSSTPVTADGVVDNVTPIVDNTDEDAIKTEVPAVLVINDDGTSNAS